MRPKLSIILVHIVLCILCAQSTAQELVKWSEKDKVDWHFFKAKPKANSKHSASINTGIKYSWKTKYVNAKQVLSYEVLAYMIPEKSWVKSGQQNDYILSHELLHFDITELHARKIKKSFDEYALKSSVKRDLKSIYDSIMKQRFDMQKKYDRETNHGLNKANQKKWQLKIDKMLKAFSD